jgi:hypothetical protein
MGDLPHSTPAAPRGLASHYFEDRGDNDYQHEIRKLPPSDTRISTISDTAVVHCPSGLGKIRRHRRLGRNFGTTSAWEPGLEQIGHRRESCLADL